MFRLVLKGLSLSAVVGSYVLSSLPIRLLLRQEKARWILTRNLRFHAFAVLWILGISVETQNAEAITHPNYLVVSNHLSYTDVLIISSIFPAVFVTSVEVRDSAGLGQICKAGGSLFIERRNRASLANEVDLISGVLAAGHFVAIFPEGTTSAGDRMLDFRRSLFGAASKAHIAVLPLCINYTQADGRPVDGKTRDSVFYYGEMQFLAHLVRLLKLRRVTVKVSVISPLEKSEDRKVAAAYAFSEIQSRYLPVTV